MKKIWLAAIAAAFALAMPALAGGFLTNGLPVAGASPYAGTLPLTGSEQFPADTMRAGGAAPQSEAITLAQITTYAQTNVTADSVKTKAFGTASTSGATTATATSGAATCNADRCSVTSESLTTASGTWYTLTVTDSSITATSIVLAMAANGTNTTEGAVVTRVNPGAGSAVFAVKNSNGTSALNGTVVVKFVVIN